jgi:hypothetical protein
MGLGGGLVYKEEGERQGRGEEGSGGFDEGDEGAELVQWAYKMARALKAKEWVRRGSEISFAIPCNVIHESADEKVSPLALPS